MSRKEAAAAARREFGNVALIEEDSREVWRWPSMEDLATDVRYGLRILPKRPTFTLTVVLTLAIGIGGNTAMFTLIRAVLLKPLEYRDPDRLVSLSLTDFHQNKRDGSFTLKRVDEMRASSKAFSAIGAFLKLPENISLSGRREPEALVGARVSANFLDILNVKPRLGRSFLEEEDAPGAPPVAMISGRLWRRVFQGDPQVVGKTATLNAIPHIIIGVLPDNFAFPFVGTDIWMARPAEWSVIPPGARPHVTILNGFARLQPQVSLQQAQAELDVLNRQYVLEPRQVGCRTRSVDRSRVTERSVCSQCTPNALDAVWRGRLRFVNRLRQCRGSAAGAGELPSPRVCRARGTGSCRWPAGPSTIGRKLDAGGWGRFYGVVASEVCSICGEASYRAPTAACGRDPSGQHGAGVRRGSFHRHRNLVWTVPITAGVAPRSHSRITRKRCGRRGRIVGAAKNTGHPCAWNIGCWTDFLVYRATHRGDAADQELCSPAQRRPGISLCKFIDNENHFAAGAL